MNAPNETGSSAGRRILKATNRTVPLSVRQPVIPLDAKATWVDKPQMPQQIGKKGLWKPDRVEVKIFDLSDAQQLKDYAALLTLAAAEDTNIFLMSNERMFCRGTQNWKALVQIQHVKFRQMLQQKSMGDVPEDRAQEN